MSSDAGSMIQTRRSSQMSDAGHVPVARRDSQMSDYDRQMAPVVHQSELDQQQQELIQDPPQASQHVAQHPPLPQMSQPRPPLQQMSQPQLQQFIQPPSIPQDDANLHNLPSGAAARTSNQVSNLPEPSSNQLASFSHQPKALMRKKFCPLPSPGSQLASLQYLV